VIVTIMLIPQSLAYAMLAGMPPEAGLYASILPIIAYAVFGSSRVLAVGPVAVVSLMTAAALGSVAESGTADYATAALTLAALSGAMLFGMGLLRMGFIANFLSHPVTAGFITASAVLIAMGQIGPLIGVKMTGASVPELVESFWAGKAAFNWQTLVIGALGVAFLSWVRQRMKPTLRALGVGPVLADVLTKAGPVMAVAASTLFFVIVPGRMIPAIALVTSTAVPRLRGTFMSLNASVQSLSQAAGAYIAGSLLVRTADGRIESYGTVGWIAVAVTLVSVAWVETLRPAVPESPRA
jgi:MFS superfamily sulfate permease-like transporter